MVKNVSEGKEKMQGVGSWRRFIVATFASITSCIALAADSPKFGKTTVAEHKVPASTVIRYADLKVERIGQDATGKDPSHITWYGPEIPIDPKNNPFKISVKVLGVALADGDVALVWQGGFRKEDDTTVATNLLMAEAKVKAGETVLIEGAAPPLSFKEPQKVAPALALVVRRNIDVKSVEIKVWSGIGSGSWFEVLLSFWYLWVGVIVFVLWRYWRS